MTVPPPPVRAQLLATEHWSLLAARGMTWSEVMGRITIHLTIASAALVVLALVTQATGFGTTAFDVLSIGLTSVILTLGTLTGVRVHNASREDAAIVVGMNRLRAAYVRMDPEIAEYLVTSPYDDQAGLMATYAMGMRRSTISHVIASTSMFINIVNAIVAGTLGRSSVRRLRVTPRRLPSRGSSRGWPTSPSSSRLRDGRSPCFRWTPGSRRRPPSKAPTTQSRS